MAHTLTGRSAGKKVHQHIACKHRKYKLDECKERNNDNTLQNFADNVE